MPELRAKKEKSMRLLPTTPWKTKRGENLFMQMQAYPTIIFQQFEDVFLSQNKRKIWKQLQPPISMRHPTTF